MFLSWKLDRLLALSLMPLALCMPLNKTAAQEAASPEAVAQSVEAPVSQAPSPSTGSPPAYSEMDILADRIPGDSLSDLALAVSHPLPDEVIAFHKKIKQNAFMRHAGVRAPTNGIVSAVHVETIGAVVQPGSVLAEIIPDEQDILINARVKPEDIANIYTDQIAQVALSAYDVSRYGNLEGRVQKIAANTTEEENMLPYYRTVIAVPSARLSKSDEEIEIKPGMAVTVDIIGKKRSVLNYFFTPLNRASGVVFREN